MTTPPPRPRRTAPDLYVTVRGDLALVRGPGAERAVRMALVEGAASWSRSGRGWVIEAADVPDVLAWAQSSRLLAVISQEQAPGGAA